MNDISWLDGLKYKLFNIFPYLDTPFVQTEDGSIFWIRFVDQKPERINICKNARIYGLIELHWKKETLEIWNIILSPKFRGQGLGTQLLNWLISYARQENMKELWGLVVPCKEENFDRTMAWYLRNGFLRETPSGDSIRMRL